MNDNKKNEGYIDIYSQYKEFKDSSLEEYILLWNSSSNEMKIKMIHNCNIEYFFNYNNIIINQIIENKNDYYALKLYEKYIDDKKYYYPFNEEYFGYDKIKNIKSYIENSESLEKAYNEIKDKYDLLCKGKWEYTDYIDFINSDFFNDYKDDYLERIKIKDIINILFLYCDESQILDEFDLINHEITPIENFIITSLEKRYLIKKGDNYERRKNYEDLTFIEAEKEIEDFLSKKGHIISKCIAQFYFIKLCWVLEDQIYYGDLKDEDFNDGVIKYKEDNLKLDILNNEYECKDIIVKKINGTITEDQDDLFLYNSKEIYEKLIIDYSTIIEIKKAYDESSHDKDETLRIIEEILVNHKITSLAYTKYLYQFFIVEKRKHNCKWFQSPNIQKNINIKLKELLVISPSHNEILLYNITTCILNNNLDIPQFEDKLQKLKKSHKSELDIIRAMDNDYFFEQYKDIFTLPFIDFHEELLKPEVLYSNYPDFIKPIIYSLSNENQKLRKELNTILINQKDIYENHQEIINDITINNLKNQINQTKIIITTMVIGFLLILIYN